MTNVSGFACFISEKGTELSQTLQKSSSLSKETARWLIFAALLGLVAFGSNLWGQSIARQNPTIAVQMYVISVDDGADIERHRIEQAGDQFTYDLPEHVMQNIQQSPTFVSCIDGLAISSVLTEFAEEASCDGPAIHVVLIAPY